MGFRNPVRVTCVEAGVRRATRICSWMLLIAMCVTAGCSAGAGSAPAAAKRPSAAAANGWRAVSYHGVHVDVPAGWPVVDGMHTLFCGGPFPARPTAFVGPQDNRAPACPAPLPGTSAGRDGIWLQQGSPPSGARPVATASGKVVLEGNPGWGGPLKRLWYHRVLVEIGIGPEPAIARAILNSIGFTPHSPDSRAAGVCARSASPDSMPAPQRLARRLVLEQGDVTLDPPLPSDQPAMSAAQAWNESGPREPFSRYRLILTRYSAKFPARQNPDGSVTPLNQNELAWVIYSKPYSATIAGCGGWGLVVFDARNGHGITSSSWQPGP
jgi:hypothetical protein